VVFVEVVPSPPPPQPTSVITAVRIITPMNSNLNPGRYAVLISISFVIG
jgi:hypothetical protein